MERTLPLKALARRARLVLLAALTVVGLTTCDVLKQAQGTYNMVNCKYDFRSLTGVTIAGIDLSKGVSAADAPKILALVSSLGGGNSSSTGILGALGSILGGGSSASNAAPGSIPIGCVVNLNVQNPNTTEALLNGMEYTLAIDGVNFTSGSVAQQLNVAPGATGVLPLAMSFDAATLLKGESRNAVIGVIRNIAGLGVGSLTNDTASKVALDIRPSFNIAGATVKSPIAIPVNFSFGGK